MGRRIPRSTKEKVISRWLRGKLRDLIARELKLSTGSVTTIIQEHRRKDLQFDLLRVVALQLREQDITVESIDPLMEALRVFCFNRKTTVPDFGNQVYVLCQTANKFVVALEDMPAYVINLEKTANAMINKLESLKVQKTRLLSDYEITSDVI